MTGAQYLMTGANFILFLCLVYNTYISEQIQSDGQCHRNDQGVEIAPRGENLPVKTAIPD